MYKQLRTELYGDKPMKETERPLVVSCFYCEMTMWSISDNAFVEQSTGRIVCSGCRTPREQPEPLPA